MNEELYNYLLDEIEKCEEKIEELSYNNNYTSYNSMLTADSLNNNLEIASVNGEKIALQRVISHLQFLE